MGDMADDLTDSGFDLISRHASGDCEIGCPYCEDECNEKPEVVDEGMALGLKKLKVLRVSADTGKAFLCHLDDDMEYWIPKSQIMCAECFKGGQINRDMFVQQWFTDQMKPITTPRRPDVVMVLKDGTKVSSKDGVLTYEHPKNSIEK